MPTKTRGKPRQRRFEDDAQQVLGRLQKALRGLLKELPGVVRRASDVRQELGIDKMLAWQVFRFAGSDNPVAAAVDLPGSAALRTFIRAAGRTAQAKSVKSATAAVEDLERVIAEHADDRKTFDAMLSGLAGEEGEQIDLPSRRAAFRANSRIWGMRATTHLNCMLVNASPVDASFFDVVGIRGFLQLRRMRSDASLMIASTRVLDDAGKPVDSGANESLGDSPGSPEGLSVLREFCTHPFPELKRVTTPSGFVNFEIAGNEIGTKSEVTCVTAHAWRRAGERFATERNRRLASTSVIRLPCEVLVQDILVHRDLFKVDPSMIVYGNHRGDVTMGPRRSSDVLPLRESITHLGMGSRVLGTPDVPRYGDIAQYVFDRLGWNGQDFNVYRCRVEYPVMPSSVVVQFDLPEKPG